MELSERRIWTLAIAASLALHGLVLFCAPSLTSGRQDPPVMKVSLVAITASPITKNAVPTPGRSSVVKRQPKQAVVGHPAPALAKKSAVRSVQQLKEKPKAASSSSPVASKPSQFGEAASFQQAGSGSGGGEPAGSGYGGGQGAGPADGGTSGGTGGTEEAVDVNTLVVTKKVLPDYPSFSRKRREEGTVKIIITIEKGGVTKAEVESSSGYERLDASALRAVKQWRFDSSGTVRARVPFTFRLQ